MEVKFSYAATSDQMSWDQAGNITSAAVPLVST